MLADVDAERAAMDAADRFLGLRITDGVGIVALYRAVERELSPDPLFGPLMGHGRRICYPVVAGDLLVFRSVDSLTRFVPGRFGIPEPPPGEPEVTVGEIDLFLLPGVAFDLEGHRIGYGAGYYDRTLKRRNPEALLVGYCYDFQLVERVPRFDHDIVADVIVTEHRVVYPPRDLHRGGGKWM